MSSPWNHGKISRHAGEQLLVANGKDGAFLVRQSESVHDAHVLSLWFEGMVHHFRILKKEEKFVVQASAGNSARLFSSLEDIIELFKQPGQGLPHQLKEPIFKETINELEPEGDPETDDDDDDDEDERKDPGWSDEVDNRSPIEEKVDQMDCSGLCSNFLGNVRRYLREGLEKDGEKSSVGEPATELQQLIVGSAEGVKRELQDFLKGVMFLQELLCTDERLRKLGILDSPTVRQSKNASGYDDLVQDLAKCVAGIKFLEMLVKKPEQSQTRTFEVTSCGNFKTRSYLKVDITKGKLWFMKNEKDSEDSTIVDHKEILQSVKDPDAPKLTIRMTKSNRDYLFKDVQAREIFCQLVQHMKNTHNSEKQPNRISIFVGTWNMGSVAPNKIESWLHCHGTGEKMDDTEIVDVVGHDIYAIGTQESYFSEASWISMLKRVLKEQFKVDYETVATQSFWGIRLVILAKPEHRNRISRVEGSSVKTGIANTLGNKGGVGISFDFLSTSLCFINCHLTSGNEEIRKQRRQQNYMDILKGLNLGHKSAYDLTNQFHHVFWFGDLNYRIDMSYEEIITAINGMDYKKLATEDQLKKEQKLGNVFVSFHESMPQFPPTYRYKRGTRESYEHVKIKRAGNRINVPSWCDRVLWTSFPDLSVEQNSYGCTKDIVSSDHSPVFSSFNVPIKSQFVASPEKVTKKQPCKINIPFITVKVKTVSKTDFYLEFHSVCLSTSERSKAGKQSSPWDAPRAVNSNPSLTSYLKWTDTLPELIPILDNPNYLREQHLLIAVKSEAGDESYGECVVSLKLHVFHTPQSFQADLTHGGVKTGEIRGSMNVQHPQFASAVRRPPIHAKPVFDHTQKSPKTQHRPFSCLTPAVSDTLPAIGKKSASLGRTMLPTPDRRTSGPAPGTKNLSTYITLSTYVTSSNNPCDQVTNENLVPPPLPAKTSSSKTSALRPATVDEFLSRLGLGCYLPNLEENGFDDLTFLENISDEDLANSGITDIGHVKKILDEVENLRKAGVFSHP